MSSSQTMIDGAPVALLTRMESWLGARRRLVLGCLLGLAALLRIVAFSELMDTPVEAAYRHSEMDMQFFDRWAARIVLSDLLGREPSHPTHLWHHHVARDYFELHPQALQGKKFTELDAKARNVAVQRLWNRLYGGNRFHQEPLYAYMIAAAYSAWGAPDVRIVYALQMFCGVLVVGLLFGSTRRLFGDLTATLSGLMALFWGPLIHYETVLLRTSCIILAGMALLYFAQRLDENKTRTGHGRLLSLFAFGCLVGVSTALKTTLFPFSLGLALWLVWPLLGKGWKTVLAACTAMALGTVLVLSPFFLRNLLVGAPLLSLTSVAAATFAGTNIPGWDPAYGWFPYADSSAFARAMAEGEGDFRATVWATLGQHSSIGSYLTLLWWKFCLVWHWFELPNNTNFYYTILHSTILNVMRHLVAVWWVMPAAVVGIGFALRRRRRRRSIAIWLWFLACCLVPMLVFYVLSRFRAPMVVAMMPFAAYGIVCSVERLLQRRLVPVALAGLLFIGLAAWMNRDFRTPRAIVGSGTHAWALHNYYGPWAEAAQKTGEPLVAAWILEQMLETEPPFIRELSDSRPPANIFDKKTAEVFATLYDKCALAHEAARERERALSYRRRARQIRQAIQLLDKR